MNTINSIPFIELRQEAKFYFNDEMKTSIDYILNNAGFGSALKNAARAAMYELRDIRQDQQIERVRAKYIVPSLWGRIMNWAARYRSKSITYQLLKALK